ncbi:MAG: Gfo/Idh/MocA family oxidoreductase [Candidatus Bathyarchaeia archaeon]
MGISLGLVGLGMFGRSFIELFMKHPDVDRFALCDLRRDRLDYYAKKYEVAETYISLEAICQSDIEAVAIITQHWLHAAQAVQALKAGKHVYSAVPPAYSLEECDLLVKTVKETGLLYMLGETSYFYPEAFFCRRKAAEGAFGEFVHCRAEYFHDMSHGLYDVFRNRWGEQWAKEKGGDPPMYYPTHSVCFPVSVMKAHMTEVSAQGFVYPNDDFFREDTIYRNPFSNETALFKMSNGATALISEFRRVGHPGTVRANGIYGTEGSFEHSLAGAAWADKRGKQNVDLTRRYEQLPEPLASQTGSHEGAEAYLAHEFVDSVNQNRLPRINVWEAVRYSAPGIVAHQSALLGGTPLKVPDWGDPPEQV